MEKMQALRELLHWFVREGIYDPANDGREVKIIRREQNNEFLDWYDSFPARWGRAWRMAKAFVRRWNPDVR